MKSPLKRIPSLAAAALLGRLLPAQTPKPAAPAAAPLLSAGYDGKTSPTRLPPGARAETSSTDRPPPSPERTAPPPPSILARKAANRRRTSRKPSSS